MGDGWSIAWRVLDAQYWGVPQRRRRIFLVADFGGQSAPEILFKREGLSRHIAESEEARERVAANVERSSYQTVAGFDLNQITCPENRSLIETGKPQPTLCKDGRPSVIHSYCGFLSRNSENARSLGYEENKSPTLRRGMTPDVICAGFNGYKSVSGSIQYQEETAATLESNMPGNVVSGTVSAKWAKGTGGPAGDECQNLVVTQKRFGEYEPGVSAVMTGSGSGKTGENLVVTAVDCRNLYENIEKSATLQSKSGGGTSLSYQNPIRIGYAVRRLTPLECERLQDYPDGWTNIPDTSDTARYKACGNSVAVCCPEYVLEGIREVLISSQIADLLNEFDFLN